MLTEINNMATELAYDNQFAEKLTALKQQGNYRYFLPLHKSAEKQPVFGFDTEGGLKSATNWTSNDYMGMSADVDVIDAFIAAAKQDGIGSGGTRNISGTTQRHRQLEYALAKLHNKQAALVFGSAYTANSTAISTLARAFPNCIIFSDAENHASMIEGIKLSRCEKRIFRHNDAAHLAELLAAEDLDRPKIIAFESVYSMSGTIAPIKKFIDLAKHFNALTYLDEVHAVGMYGEKGEGVAGQLGLSDGIDVLNATLAKGFGCVGGYIAASETVVDYIRSFGEGFIFTSSMPPAICAAAVKSVEKVTISNDLRIKFHKNVEILRGCLSAENIAFEGKEAHITRIVIGDSRRCRAITDRLLREFSVYLQPINFPTVPKGEECMRIIATARHTEEQIFELVKALKQCL
jgi:5-aminolevulinate synthase